MTIQQCKYVLTIADIGSFSKAAQVLYVSQSGLSESVKALEDGTTDNQRTYEQR